MLRERFPTREGGVKIVFDVPEAQVRDATRQFAQAGCEVHRYYESGCEHGPGRAPIGWIRLGAERAMYEFTEAEQDRISAELQAVRASAGAAGIVCATVGVDIWTAGDGGTGVREPRRPHPRVAAGAAEVARTR